MLTVAVLQLVWLHRSIDSQDIKLVPLIPIARFLDPLQADQRFDELIHRLEEIEAEAGEKRS